MAEKRNIFLVGPMGAGKSTIGRQLAQQLNMDFVDSDAVIEERAGADITRRCAFHWWWSSDVKRKS